jgi:PTS system galactitol-specific IIB component
MKLEKVLKQHGIEADLYKGLALEAARLAQGADLIVATTALPQGDYGVPVVNGVPLLTGIGEEETIRKIVELLKEV